MRQGLYCVYDAKIGNYSMPYFAQTDAQAIRSFRDALAQEGSLLNKHPEDFALVRIASVMDETGEVQTPVTPQRIDDGAQAVSSQLGKGDSK